jgi:hypothetical protein
MFIHLPKPCKLAEHMNAPIIFERTPTGWNAPDLSNFDGVASPTYEATGQLIREGFLADGDPIPEPITRQNRMPISA